MTRQARTVVERGLGALCAALTLLVWPAALWHELTTVHRICPEHGEVVDVGAGQSVPDCTPYPEHDSGEHGPLFTGDPEHGDPQQGEHEHCPFVTLSSPVAPATGAHDAGVRAPEIRGLRSSGSAARHLSIPILSQAPKQSPPA